MKNKSDAKKSFKSGKAFKRLKNRGLGKRRTRLAMTGFTDLSQYEEEKDKSFLEEVGKKAAKNAVNENKALGIPVTFLKDDWVVRRMPDGSIVKLKQVKLSGKLIKLKKGTVIHVGRISH